jgi:hypothetical protein
MDFEDQKMQKLLGLSKPFAKLKAPSTADRDFFIPPDGEPSSF